MQKSLGNMRKGQLLRSLFSDPLPEGHPVDKDNCLSYPGTIRGKLGEFCANSASARWEPTELSSWNSVRSKNLGTEEKRVITKGVSSLEESSERKGT